MTYYQPKKVKSLKVLPTMFGPFGRKWLDLSGLARYKIAETPEGAEVASSLPKPKPTPINKPPMPPSYGTEGGSQKIPPANPAIQSTEPPKVTPAPRGMDEISSSWDKPQSANDARAEYDVEEERVNRVDKWIDHVISLGDLPDMHDYPNPKEYWNAVVPKIIKRAVEDHVISSDNKEEVKIFKEMIGLWITEEWDKQHGKSFSDYHQKIAETPEGREVASSAKKPPPLPAPPAQSAENIEVQSGLPPFIVQNLRGVSDELAEMSQPPPKPKKPKKPPVESGEDLSVEDLIGKWNESGFDDEGEPTHLVQRDPSDIAFEKWMNSEYGQEWHNWSEEEFLRRLKEDGIRDNEVEERLRKFSEEVRGISDEELEQAQREWERDHPGQIEESPDTEKLLEGDLDFDKLSEEEELELTRDLDREDSRTGDWRDKPNRKLEENYAQDRQKAVSEWARDYVGSVSEEFDPGVYADKGDYIKGVVDGIINNAQEIELDEKSTVLAVKQARQEAEQVWKNYQKIVDNPDMLNEFFGLNGSEELEFTPPEDWDEEIRDWTPEEDEEVEDEDSSEGQPDKILDRQLLDKATDLISEYLSNIDPERFTDRDTFTMYLTRQLEVQLSKDERFRNIPFQHIASLIEPLIFNDAWLEYRRRQGGKSFPDYHQKIAETPEGADVAASVNKPPPKPTKPASPPTPPPQSAENIEIQSAPGDPFEQEIENYHPPKEVEDVGFTPPTEWSKEGDEQTAAEAGDVNEWEVGDERNDEVDETEDEIDLDLDETPEGLEESPGEELRKADRLLSKRLQSGEDPTKAITDWVSIYSRNVGFHEWIDDFPVRRDFINDMVEQLDSVAHREAQEEGLQLTEDQRQLLRKIAAQEANRLWRRHEEGGGE